MYAVCLSMHLLVFLLVLSLAPIPASADSTCKAGTFSSDGNKPCTNCPAGSFNSFAGATSCCTCCAGFYQSGTGQTSCTACPGNGYSPPGSTSISACTTSSGGLTTCDQTSLTTCPATGAMTSHNPRYIARRQTCPRGHKNCPVYGLSGNKRVVKHYECVGVDHDLESCGGCVNDDSPFGERTADGGRDCSAIPNVDRVRCEGGKCEISTCRDGYYLTGDGEMCLPSFTPVHFYGFE